MATKTDAERLVDLAARIARYAPAKQGNYVHRAGIRWTLIHELRNTLDALGVEWRKP